MRVTVGCTSSADTFAYEERLLKAKGGGADGLLYIDVVRALTSASLTESYAAQTDLVKVRSSFPERYTSAA